MCCEGVIALQEPVIQVRSREELLYLLAEAAEIEHNLMCCYLFAAFGLKGEADGLSAEDTREVTGWKRAIIGVAVEEMSHLALVANLTSAIGGSPHFARPNFPIPQGYHPSGVVVQLRRFDMETLEHFIFLERPEGVDGMDPSSFSSQAKNGFERKMTSRKFMPSAQDYFTVGHLYRGIRDGLQGLAKTLGAEKLFSGDPALQVGSDVANLPGLAVVTDLKSALAAIDTIVEQGEGSPADVEHSHYRRFLKVKASFEARLAQDKKFDPSRPVAPNPVMRPPTDPKGKSYVDLPESADVLELANAIYAAMLRALVQAFAEPDPARKRKLMDAAIDGMFAIGPVAEYLTTLPASKALPGLTAGMSFATLRDVSAAPVTSPVEQVFAERLRELATGAAQVLPSTRGTSVRDALRGIADKLAGAVVADATAVEVAEGSDVVISFETKRCIHARFCVLQQPGVFKANVVGAWIVPDDATSAEGLVAVAQNCPSGAITYRRKDGGPEEAAPPVNLVQVRENGPLAFRGDLKIAGEAKGFRATLCRCGQSKNKPYCDGAHAVAKFAATGECALGDVTPLAMRSGPVDIRPQTNGPLLVKGNIELISGTGRTFCKTESAMFCRCGASANKPFCDGSHARVGFKSA
jgi:CDGSH-type Zn-finger protein/uncharacterized Fe-S cluster protein YjdI